MDGIDAKAMVSITMPLYQWLIILGVLSGSGTDIGTFDAFSDKLMEIIQP